MENLVVERSVWIAAPRERVWQAVTNPEQVVQWLVPGLPGAMMKRDDEDGKVTVHLGEMGLDFAILQMIDPLRHVTMHSLPENLIKTTYRLEDQEGGTRFTVMMTGFEALPADAREDRLSLSGTGWENTLKNLKAYAEGSELVFPFAFVGPLFGYWRAPGKKLAVERSIWINASCERVWRAISDPKQIQQWFSPETEWQLSALEVGGRFYVQNAETNTEMYVEIIELLDPPYQLVTRCLPAAPDTIIKTKTYTLQEEKGGTRLLVTLAGYEPEPDESRWGHMEENTVGFGMMLQNTKAYVEGESLPFPAGF
jgi:uncharacterized protein YndB with AHSA1/START domain